VILRALYELAEPKVDDLNLSKLASKGLLVHDVLGFQIPVHHSITVTMIDGEE
jgi:hypothetical protein